MGSLKNVVDSMSCLKKIHFQVDKDDKIDKNPAVFVNPEQPLISKLEVHEDEITAQEAKVKEARERLAQAIKALGWG